MDKETAEKYIEIIRRAAEAISWITGWLWHENICYPWDEECKIRRSSVYHPEGYISKQQHGKYYLVVFIPKGIFWFKGITWSNRNELIEESDDLKKIKMETQCTLRVPQHYVWYRNKEGFSRKMGNKISEAQRITEKWAREASEKFNVKIRAYIDPDWGVPSVKYEFTPDNFDTYEVQRAFMAMKYAYMGAIKEINKDFRGEEYIKTIRRAAEAISEITGWRWYENICYPWDERKIVIFSNGYVSVDENEYNNYFVHFKPQGIDWFLGISWWTSKDDWEKIEMETKWIFKVPEDKSDIPDGYDLEEFYHKLEPIIRKGQSIAGKWAREASEKFNVKIRAYIDPDWGEPSFVFDFTPRSFNPDRIKRAFMALKYAYEGSLNQLKERKMVIFDKCLKEWMIVP